MEQHKLKKLNQKKLKKKLRKQKENNYVKTIIKAKAPEVREFIYTPGRYEVLVEAVEQGTNQNTGALFYKFVLRGNFGENLTMFNLFVRDNTYGQEQLYKIIEAVGLDPNSDDIDTDDIVGKYMGVEIKEGDPYNGKRQFNVRDIFALDEEEEKGSTDSDADDDWADAE